MTPAIKVAKGVYNDCLLFGKSDPFATAASRIEADRAEHVLEILETLLIEVASADSDNDGMAPISAVRSVIKRCLQLPEPEPSKEALSAAAEIFFHESPREDFLKAKARMIDRHMRSHGR